MRKLFNLSIVLAILFAALSTAGLSHAADDTKTIYELAAGNADLSTLAAAIKAAGLTDVLSGGGPYTVFAPTNAAFDAALKVLDTTAEKLMADKALLTKILFYHVVPGKFMAADVAGLDGQKIASALWGGTLAVKTSGDKVIINNANVTAADGAASNGVVHIVDAVLVPDAAALKFGDKELAFTLKADKDVVGTAAGSDKLKTLVAAVSAAPDMAKFLTDKGRIFTLFAPTDDAFDSALKTMNVTAADFLKDTKTLNSVLAFQLVPFLYNAEAVAALDGALLGTAQPGTVLAVTVKDGKVFVNGVEVVAPDINATNGIIHLTDGVLLPPPPDVTATPDATPAK